MDGGAKKLLESVTFETLHAHHFSRSSSQAANVLTDLLARYLMLLATSCTKYAEHAGRLRLNMRDAMSALDDLGVGMDELSEYCASEGRELSRYAVHTTRRVEDLSEFKACLTYGLREDRDDAIPLVYAPVSDDILWEEVEESEEEDNTQIDVDMEIMMQADSVPAEMPTQEQKDTQAELRLEYAHAQRPPTPPLPLSPVSNSPSPSPPRKRARTASWRPPAHIPEFLPPFPTDSPRHSPTPAPELANIAPNLVKVERPATPPPQPQITALSTSADYLTPIPYELSTLSSAPAWHLPAPPSGSAVSTQPPRLSVPQLQPSLLAAYHHVLTNPPSKQLSTANPARYRVALALVSQSEKLPRWDVPATLFSSTAPNIPRVAAMSPSHPVPVVSASATSSTSKVDKERGNDKDFKLAPSVSRPIAPCERLTPLVSQQSSRIPKLARQLLPSNVYSRTTRVSHPPALFRGTTKLVYGPGIPAPWNSTPSSTPAPDTKANGTAKDLTAAKVLEDARLYATWNYEPKHFKDPLVLPRRARIGSTHSVNMSGGGTPRVRSPSRGL